MMKNLKIGLTIVIFAAAVFIIWLLTSARTQHVPTKLPNPHFIKTAKPHLMNFELKAHWIGKSEAKQKITIPALAEGTIISVDANDENIVKKGATLLRLSGPAIETKLATAREKVSSLQERLSIALNTVARKQEAVKEKISSLDELASAKESLEQIKTELETAKEQLKLLQDAASIPAPISGIFTGRKVSVGQKVAKDRVLAEIIVPEQVRIIATIFSDETSGLEDRQVTFKAPDGNSISGTINKVLPESTSAGGTIVWIEGKEINKQIKPGQYLNGQVITAFHNNVLAVPTSAIVYDENDIPYVFIKQGAEYEKTKVQIGFISDGWVEIVSGVTESDEIATEGAYELYYRDFNKSYKVPD
jgi:RND family efflux transporter MFP subunit